MKATKTNKYGIRQSTGDVLFDVVITACVILFTLVALYPLYFTVIASISEPVDVVRGNVVFLPSGFTLEAYQNVVKESSIWIGYRNSILYALFGTLFNLALTLPCAYALSCRELPGRRMLNLIFIFTMYFSGGLIPTYLLVKQLGLINTPYTLVILGGISIYNTIVTRTYFENNIPGEIYESASIDGANEFRSFFTIALPLARPIIAVITLFYAVTHWNSYFNAYLYVTKTEYQPLQLVLRSILLMNQGATAALDPDALDSEMVQEMARRTYVAYSMKYALIFIASAPLLIAYPFVQKHFVTGIMIGSVKG